MDISEFITLYTWAVLSTLHVQSRVYKIMDISEFITLYTWAVLSTLHVQSRVYKNKFVNNLQILRILVYLVMEKGKGRNGFV